MLRGKGTEVRILLLSNLYPPYIQGGAEILAADVAARLEYLGHEVLVLTSTPSTSESSPFQKDDGRIWRTLYCAPPAHFDRHRPLWQQVRLPYNYYRRYHNPVNAAEVRRVIASTRPDVIYVWEMAGVGVTSLLHVLATLDIPTVFHLNSYWLLYANSPDTQQSRMRIRWLKQKLIGTLPDLTSSSFIAISETVKQTYVQAGFDTAHIEVIYNGIDQRFLELPRADNDVKEHSQLLFVGRLRVEKGLLVLLKALDILMNEQHVQHSLRLTIFGSGDAVYKKELEAFLHAKHLSQAVTFGGTVPQNELIQHYDQADMLLVPSLWKEPFGLVVAEAMARGLPVIASKIGGPAEIITHGMNGLLTEPGNAQALAVAIRTLLDTPEQGRLLGQAARQTVREHFMIEKNTQHIEHSLHHAVKEYQRTTHSTHSPLGA